jgi:hypothetical protein
MMADNQLLNGVGGGGDDIFVYTGGEQQVPRGVKRVRIAENVDTIPRWTFDGCRQLIEVEGHNKLKKIEHRAFKNCPLLRRMMKMRGVVEIEEFAFNECNALSELEFGKLEMIGNFAFTGCESLRSINMPSLRRVGRFAFERCRALTDVVFGKDLEGIEEGAFTKCTALRRIAIPLKDNLIAENNTFNGCVFGNLSRVDLVGEIHKTQCVVQRLLLNYTLVSGLYNRCLFFRNLYIVPVGLTIIFGLLHFQTFFTLIDMFLNK